MSDGAVGVEGNAVVITSGNHGGGVAHGVVGGVGSHGVVGGVSGGETAGV